MPLHILPTPVGFSQTFKVTVTILQGFPINKIKPSALVITLVLAQQAVAGQVIIINNATDLALDFANKLLTKKGWGIQKLPPLIYQEIEMYNGFLVGTNSLSRTQDATITFNDDNSTTAEFHIGRQLYELVFGLIKQNCEEMTGVYSIRNNSIHISFTIYNQSSCCVQLHKYEYEVLTDVTFRSSNPRYNGDVSEVFDRTVKPLINEKLESKKTLVEHAIQTAICENINSLQKIDHVTSILTTAVLQF